MGEQVFTSNLVSIKVLQQEKEIIPREINSDNVFIKCIVPKTKVRLEEEILVTFRLYTKFGVDSIVRFIPLKFENFTSKFTIIPVHEGNQAMQLEHYNEDNYYAIDVCKIRICPIRGGIFTMPLLSLILDLQFPSGVETLFGEEMKTVWKTIVSDADTIEVVAPSPLGLI